MAKEVSMSPEELDTIISYLKEINQGITNAIEKGKQIDASKFEFCKQGKSKKEIEYIPEAIGKIAALECHYLLMTEHIITIKEEMTGLDTSIANEITSGSIGKG